MKLSLLRDIAIVRIFAFLLAIIIIIIVIIIIIIIIIILLFGLLPQGQLWASFKGTTSHTRFQSFWATILT